jgi:hypothetical protein
MFTNEKHLNGKINRAKKKERILVKCEECYQHGKRRLEKGR